MAATGIAQAVALTPEPDDPITTDPDAAANTAEAAAKDQLTKEAFQNPDNQKVNIDENGNAIPSELKDDVVAQIAEQAKAAGEQARQEAIESNSQAQQKYDEQHAKREQEMSLSSGLATVLVVR